MVAPRLFYGDAPYGSVATIDSLPAIARRGPARLAPGARWHPGDRADRHQRRDRARPRRSGMAGRCSATGAAKRPAPRRSRRPAPARPSRSRTIVIDLPGAGQAAVLAAVRAVDRVGDPDYYPLLLANAVLGVGSNGRLFEEVRTKRGLSYGAYSGFPSRAGRRGADAPPRRPRTRPPTRSCRSSSTSSPRSARSRRPRTRSRSGGSTSTARDPPARDQQRLQRVVAGLLQQGIAPRRGDAFTADRLGAVTPELAADVARRYVTPRAGVGRRGRQRRRVPRRLAQDPARPGGDPGGRARPVERGPDAVRRLGAPRAPEPRRRAERGDDPAGGDHADPAEQRDGGEQPRGERRGVVGPERVRPAARWSGRTAPC